MKVAFRVDASSRMGTGHVMRCLTLADALRERGAEVSFITREHPGNLIRLLQERQIPTAALRAPASDGRPGEDYAAWLGVAQAVDAEETIKALQANRPDWLVVDHYGLDADWERRLRLHAGKLMVIDDLANRPHECDVLLDQNLSLEGRQRYRGLLPSHCRLLMGPRYALLHPTYARLRGSTRSHKGQVNKVVVFLGGADPENATGLALQALSAEGLQGIEAHVVIGASNPYREAIEGLAASRPRTVIHQAMPHLAELLSGADLAIGAGGVTTWERMCLGIPTVLISIAENQRPACEALASARLAFYAGHLDELSAVRLAAVLNEAIADPSQLAEMRIRNQLHVDGLGVRRMVEILCPSLAERLHLRAARDEDIVLFYDWANDPVVRRNSFTTEPIAWSEHRTWFNDKLRAADSRLFVLEAEGLPVGQIRFDAGDGELSIDYSLDELVRGRGWGVRLVSLGVNAVRTVSTRRICGVVKVANRASQSVFERLGFRREPGPVPDSATFALDALEVHAQ